MHNVELINKYVIVTPKNFIASAFWGSLTSILLDKCTIEHVLGCQHIYHIDYWLIMSKHIDIFCAQLCPICMEGGWGGGPYVLILGVCHWKGYHFMPGTQTRVYSRVEFPRQGCIICSLSSLGKGQGANLPWHTPIQFFLLCPPPSPPPSGMCTIMTLTTEFKLGNRVLFTEKQ